MYVYTCIHDINKSLSSIFFALVYDYRCESNRIQTFSIEMYLYNVLTIATMFCF